MSRFAPHDPEALIALCQRFAVERLELFGSHARGDATPESDIDVLVLFQRDANLPADDRYFGLLEGLAALFGRPVDLVDIRTARNPYFIAEALKHRERLYAA